MDLDDLLQKFSGIGLGGEKKSDSIERQTNYNGGFASSDSLTALRERKLRPYQEQVVEVVKHTHLSLSRCGCSDPHPLNLKNYNPVYCYGNLTIEEKSELEKFYESTEKDTKVAISLLYLPTGGGKTRIASELIRWIVRSNGYGLFIVNRTKLLEQACEAFSELGLESEVSRLGNGHKPNMKKRIQVATIQSLRALQTKEGRLPLADIVVIDEAHASYSDSYMSVIQEYVSGKYASRGEYIYKNDRKDSVEKLVHCHTSIFGLTATPIRRKVDENLSKVYQMVVCGPNMETLIDRKVLVPPITISIELEDYKSRGVSRKPPTKKRSQFGSWSFVSPSGDSFFPMGMAYQDDDEIDLEVGDISGLSSKLTFTRIIEAFKTYCMIPGEERPAVLFAQDVAHSELLVKAFNMSGVRAAHVDGTTPNSQRISIFEGLRNGDIQLLSSVGVLSEGFDEPRVSAVLLCRPSSSKGLYIQQVGRGLRSYEIGGKKDCIVLDFVGLKNTYGDVVRPIDMSNNVNNRNEILSKKVNEDDRGKGRGKHAKSEWITQTRCWMCKNCNNLNNNSLQECKLCKLTKSFSDNMMMEDSKALRGISTAEARLSTLKNAQDHGYRNNTKIFSPQPISKETFGSPLLNTDAYKSRVKEVVADTSDDDDALSDESSSSSDSSEESREIISERGKGMKSTEDEKSFKSPLGPSRSQAPLVSSSKKEKTDAFDLKSLLSSLAGISDSLSAIALDSTPKDRNVMADNRLEGDDDNEGHISQRRNPDGNRSAKEFRTPKKNLPFDSPDRRNAYYSGSSPNRHGPEKKKSELTPTRGDFRQIVDLTTPTFSSSKQKTMHNNNERHFSDRRRNSPSKSVRGGDLMTSEATKDLNLGSSKKFDYDRIIRSDSDSSDKTERVEAVDGISRESLHGRNSEGQDITSDSDRGFSSSTEVNRSTSETDSSSDSDGVIDNRNPRLMKNSVTSNSVSKNTQAIMNRGVPRSNASSVRSNCITSSNGPSTNAQHSAPVPIPIPSAKQSAHSNGVEDRQKISGYAVNTTTKSLNIGPSHMKFKGNGSRVLQKPL